MISDWSGAAIDFAFGCLGPVIFLDLPRKVNNPHYEELSLEPLEVSIRSEIGAIVRADEIDQITIHVEEMVNNSSEIRSRLRQMRNQYVFNIGNSGRVAAKEILRSLSSKEEPTVD